MLSQYEFIMRALKDGRAITTTQFFYIGFLAVSSLGLNYVWASGDESIYDNWPKLGVSISFVIATICLLAIPLGRRQDWSVHQTRLSLCAVVVASCIRQYEENTFDFMQREGEFIPFSNSMIDAWLPGFHCKDFQDCLFDKRNTMAYNTAGLWPLYMLMPFFFTSTPLFAICSCGVAVVSSCGHFVSSLVTLAYSPGSVSSLLLVCPAAMYAAHQLCTNYFVGHPSVYVAAMASGGFCHMAVAFTFFLVKLLGYVPDAFFPLGMYCIFSLALGLVCRLFGGPTEKFIAAKKLERDRERYGLMGENLEDENSALL